MARLHAPGSVEDALERHGHTPLPPYIDREDEALDGEGYRFYSYGDAMALVGDARTSAPTER